MLQILIRLQLAATSALSHLTAAATATAARRSRHDQRGQTSAEYALVLLGAAAIALLIVAWATNSDLVGKLFDTVLKAITGKVK
jgi:Flp pilus assembly pilin Flp